MQKNQFWAVLCCLTLAFGCAACGDDNETMVREDANTPAVSEDSREALVCVEQIIDGCLDIANEVGTAKIGDPYDLYVSGRTQEALYAVESWYSWHSRDDYSNNIRSIRNAYFGSRNGQVAAISLAALIAEANPELDNDVKQKIQSAINAIQAIPDPFRNHIDAPEVRLAMDACAELEETLSNLKGYMQRTAAVNSDGELQPIIEAYVNDVVLPTYKDLKEANAALYQAALAFQQAPSDAAFKAACNAWFDAREPWESSEAFLFGPVDALGLDPNMDSWPLDQDQIVNILNSGRFDHLTWSDDDSDDAIEAVQGVRGFHTMEFLIFKDGNERTVSGGNSTEAANLDYTPQNAQAWANYMVQVAFLLQQDAATLYDAWTKSYEGGKSYKDLFLNHEIEVEG